MTSLIDSKDNSFLCIKIYRILLGSSTNFFFYHIAPLPLGWENSPHGGAIVINNILHNSTLQPSLATSILMEILDFNDKFPDSFFFLTNILSIRKSEYPYGRGWPS